MQRSQRRTDPWRDPAPVESRPGSFGCLHESVELNARREGLWPLSEDHWKVIAFVRAYLEACEEVPAVVRVARATDLGSRRLYDLFPLGIIQTALRISGLPLPCDMGACAGP